MRFVDEAKIKIKAGDGGAGIIAWRREKFVPMGGPAGGNGGRGGDVVFIADEGMNSLLDIKGHSIISAKNGSKGESKNKTGRHAPERLINVPVGTIIKDKENGWQHDLKHHGQRVVVCRGGDGGFGNSHFKSRFCSAPDKATVGQKGEEKELFVTLKLMADVGLLGFPNAGKSTLLTHMSNARPKVADYPFTTLKPMVGVCEIDLGRAMVVADIPGLIEGASLGVGLGSRFLRHLERVRVLCHLIDACSEESLIKRYETINQELENYSQELSSLPQIVAINKLDSVDDEQLKEVENFESHLKNCGISSFRISALQGKGLRELKEELYKKVKNIHQICDEKPEHKSHFDPMAKLYA
ncbi:MAG: GTPase ObgE [Myxococcales bacterium]|nr:GTPase ObgE [Myxococcales bacterium]USN50014.1 MAG: GTPase ObgE [Myxococcales bacterium]